jgi:hypothetical protein
MDTEKQIQLTIQALQSKAESSVRKAALTFNFSRSTLCDRIAGMQPNKASKQHMQRLTSK